MILAAICSLVIGIGTEGLERGWYEGTAIILAIVVIVAITVVNDYMQDKQFRELFKKSERKIVKVFRNGNLKEIDAEQLLVGDIVNVETGLIFPADLILIRKNGKIC